MTVLPDPPHETEAAGTTRAADVLVVAEAAMLRLHAERVDVTRRTKQVAVVRASAVTRVHDHVVEEELAGEQVEILRVPIGRQVDFCPPVRVEGDTTILSIVEEILVVERRLVLKEEVHMTKLRTTHTHRETVQLREQHAVISRAPMDSL